MAQENSKGTLGHTQRRTERPLTGKRRLLYNYDAWGPFLKGHSTEKINANIDVFLNTQVTTVMLSPNAGQSLTYPSKAGEMCHFRELSPDERTVLYSGMGEVFGKATEGIRRLWMDEGVDPFGLLVKRAVSKGFETFVSFRMNDVHMAHMLDGQGPYTDVLYRQHPEWRVPGSWGLNYAIPEVRQHRLAQFEELIRRYPLNGLELDFLRGVPYFPGHGSSKSLPTIATRSVAGFPTYMAEESAPLMTEFVGEVRKMTQRVSKEKGKPILLAVRVPSSLSGCRRVGLDPIAWHKQGSLDFLTVGHFLHLFFDLPIEEFKNALPGLTIYGCLDYILGGPKIDGYFYARDATAEIYRAAASALLAKGSDGIHLFNMYVPRGNDPDPKGKDWRHDEPFEVLKELREPSTLENKNKLYLVDSRFDLFDKPFYDAKAQLPGEVIPEAPLITTITSGERDLSGKQITLRVVTSEPPEGVTVGMQVNGRSQGEGRRATQPHLFEEQFDQKPPSPGQCVDFAVRLNDLRYGSNEIAILSSARITVTSIEMGITNLHT
jgi:hypothetical protein